MNLRDSSLSNKIASAVFRVAELIDFDRLKAELQNCAVKLVLMESVLPIRQLRNLIILGESIGEIKVINAKVLIRELDRLENDFVLASQRPARPVLNLEEEFSAKFAGQTQPGQTQYIGRVIQPGQKPGHQPGHNKVNQRHFDEITKYVEKNIKFRFKDIQSALSQISERTIRRILEKLIGQNKLIRVGSPGPSSFYQLLEPPQHLGSQPSPILLPTPIL